MKGSYLEVKKQTNKNHMAVKKSHDWVMSNTNVNSTSKNGF